MTVGKDCTKKKKKLMIEALRKHKGLVSYASKACRVGRTSHYKWIKNDDEYAKAVDEIDNYALDYVENALFDLITDKNPTAIIFFLKTKGKKRGYIEKQEIEISTGDMTSLRNTIRECGDDEEHERNY